MNQTVAILNQKGGVGKTTVTLGLASAAVTVGTKTLVVDLDPQASSTWVLGVDPSDDMAHVGSLFTGRRPATRPIITTSTWADTLDVLPAHPSLQSHETGKVDRLAAALAEVADDYGLILIDCPPSLGSLTRSGLTAARHAILVVEPSALGLRGIGGVADLLDDVWDTTNPELVLAGAILNRVPAISNEADRRIHELSQIVGRSTIWKPVIPQRVILGQALGERRPIHSYGAAGKDASDAFSALHRKLTRVVARSAT